jgi:hypothetical protein
MFYFSRNIHFNQKGRSEKTKGKIDGEIKGISQQSKYVIIRIWTHRYTDRLRSARLSAHRSRTLSAKMNAPYHAFPKQGL